MSNSATDTSAIAPHPVAATKPTSGGKNIFWTPAERQSFIVDACMTVGVGSRGTKDPYDFRVLPRQSTPLEPTDEKEFVSSALARSIHETPKLRRIALNFYADLRTKIANHPSTRAYAAHHIRVVVKGGTAYSILSSDSFPPSDLDIVVYIDPSLSRASFNVLKTSITTLALQTLSQFKRTLDHMFFPATTSFRCNDKFLDPQDIERFKANLSAALEKNQPVADADPIVAGADAVASADPIVSYVSPLAGTRERNQVSRNSFLLTDSFVEKDAVVLIDVPHFERCETIPLRKTPIFVSHNRSLNFKRCGESSKTKTKIAETPGEEMVAKFELIRLKMNFVRINAVSKRAFPGRRASVPAGMIDVSIPDRTDHELNRFWEKETSAQGSQLIDVDVDVDENHIVRITIPTIDVLIDDLEKMLNVYDCPAYKAERRGDCLRTLQALRTKKM